MPDPVVLRPAAVSDADALARLRWLWRVAESGESGATWAEFREAFAAWWRLRQDRHLAVLATAGADPVGMAFLAVIERVPGPQHWTRLGGQLQSLFVLPERRGAGIGGQLLSAVQRLAADSGLDWVVVHPSAPSAGLYERCGFRVVDGLREWRP